MFQMEYFPIPSLTLSFLRCLPASFPSDPANLYKNMLLCSTQNKINYDDSLCLEFLAFFSETTTWEVTDVPKYTLTLNSTVYPD